MVKFGRIDGGGGRGDGVSYYSSLYHFVNSQGTGGIYRYKILYIQTVEWEICTQVVDTGVR